MKIAIVGTGSIGSTFALHLSRAGHDVTVVARGARLAQLQGDGAIVTASGERAAVTARPALDAATPYDLALVTVLASQVDAVLPDLAASAARRVMFMFNTFEPLGRLRDAVGRERFAFGFPAILATLKDGRLTSTVVTAGQITTVTDAAWAEVFTRAGIASVVTDDMESWLRTHAAMIVPFMAATFVAYTRGTGLSWDEAKRYAGALSAGFALVRDLGNRVIPAPMAVLARMPRAGAAAMFWTITRTPSLVALGVLGPGEARTLVDMMAAAAPGKVDALLAVRP